MTAKTDDSVMFAIRELQKLEADRVAEEKRRNEEQLAAAAERARKEREATEHARRVAEAEARLRVEADQRARDDELSRHMESLRRELDAVQADRMRLHERVIHASTGATPARPAPRGWAIAFGVASCVAASLAAVLLMRTPTTVAAPVSLEAQTVVAESEPRVRPASMESPPSVESVAPAPQAAVGPESPLAERPVTRLHGDRRRGARTGARATASQHEPEPREDRTLREIEEDRCGNDPTCGM